MFPIFGLLDQKYFQDNFLVMNSYWVLHYSFLDRKSTNKNTASNTITSSILSLLARKTTEFAFTSATLDVCENWSGASDKVRRERKKQPARTPCLLWVTDFDLVCWRTRHFDWSIYCKSSSVWSHAEKKQISETKKMSEKQSSERYIFLNRKIETMFWSLSKGKLWAVYQKVKMS